MSELPGLDLDSFRTFFDDACPGQVAGPLTASLVAGGKSNLTYIVTDGEHEWVVRRPPLGHVLATAHDMVREHRVMSALRDTDVPVPLTYALCQDESVLGAPFYVMERVHGTPYRSAAELEALGRDRTEQISRRSVETLATLHSVDPEAVGLADFGRPDGFLERQVRRWTKQLEASRTRELPGLDELHDRLAASAPATQPAAVVHGDYRLDNLLVDGQDRVAAVVDWEMATLGDPLTDVALMQVYGELARLDDSIADASGAPGFLTGEAMLEVYAGRSGRDLSAMGFYRALAAYKLAGILEGIYFRHVHGQTVGEGFDTVGALVGPVIGLGLDALKES